VVELLVVLAAAIWVYRWMARVERRLHDWETMQLAPLRARAETLLDDVRRLTELAHRVAAQADSATTRVNAALEAVGRRVDQTAHGARSALDLVEQGYHHLKALGVGLGYGLRAMMPFASSTSRTTPGNGRTRDQGPF
jgi:hypothetical protein